MSICTFSISVCKILSRSVKIWQYEGQKPVFESKQSLAVKNLTNMDSTLGRRH